MPSNMLDLDSRFPTLEPERDVDERFAEVKNYLYMLLEQLRYTLSHIEPENLNQTEVVRWLKEDAKVADAETIAEQLTPEIEAVTEPIVQQVTVQYITQEVPAVIQQEVPAIIQQQTPQIVNNIVHNTVTQNFITEELYAGYGSIADLTVDRLRTDWQKANKYLNGDTTDINYIYIHDEVIEFHTASVSGGTEQLHWDSRYFYWVDAQHSAMTSTEQTEWPVMVYQYSDYVKAKFAFLQNSGGTYLPTLILGAGDQNGRNRAAVCKTDQDLQLLLTCTDGTEIGLRANAATNEVTLPGYYGGVPTGSVIYYAGLSAPRGYLACDGTVYSIADYAELAAFFAANYGSANYWGGDGTATFAVPDWRGEFFRASGTNSRSGQGSGAAVGAHQDGTIHVRVSSQLYANQTKAQGQFQTWADGNWFDGLNRDSFYHSANSRWLNIGADIFSSGSASNMGYTSRPTNTSLLVCIKT